MLGLSGIAQQFFGSSNERKLRGFFKRVEEINALEDQFKTKSDDELRAMTEAFKARLANGEDLDDILPEAFATVREAAKRTLGQRHFDVQLVGGMVLHSGNISEMRTGEGKTLVATLPVYLNALAGLGVHVVTVNDYLASRDAEWMGRSINSSGSPSAVSCTGSPTSNAKPLTPATSPTARTTNSASTICATT